MLLEDPMLCREGLVPEGHARIARRFNAGNIATEHQVLKGRLNSEAGFHQSAVPSGLELRRVPLPTLKRWASRASTWGLPTTTKWQEALNCCARIRKRRMSLRDRASPNSRKASA